ncbi:hypothetical protein IQ07DRAFT_255634 [Pyrenochaeta sp. DS3sAY3a]|nr:hypothetical protein IQ07DRAFT_255634 [Pyrenochaeta sp. DS3sAY3a]
MIVGLMRLADCLVHVVSAEVAFTHCTQPSSNVEIVIDIIERYHRRRYAKSARPRLHEAARLASSGSTSEQTKATTILHRRQIEVEKTWCKNAK